MGVYQDKNSKRWYFEAMIRGKRYHQSIPEATNRREAETYFNAFKTDLLRGKLELVENIGCKPSNLVSQPLRRVIRATRLLTF